MWSVRELIQGSSRRSLSAITVAPEPAVLIQECYQANPEAYLITITGENFGYVESLSETINHSLQKVYQMIEDLLWTDAARNSLPLSLLSCLTVHTARCYLHD